MNKIKEYIKEKLIDIKINKDKEILEFIYISLDSLEKNKESLTDKLLEEIEKSINYLDQKYDNFYELVNLFDPIYVGYKKKSKTNMFNL